MGEGNVVINPETRLSTCPERQITVGLAGPLNERLDRLVELADLKGARTNRKELLAALVLGAPASASTLLEAVITLRTAKARDATVSGEPGDVLPFRRHQPGPRRKRGSGG
jgi:hypothetical protein